MTKIRFLLVGLSLSLFFSSCGAKKNVKTTNTSSRTTTSKTKRDRKETTSEKEMKIVIPYSKKSLSTTNYIDEYAGIAVNQMREYHIPASITLAQGILESRSGNSELTQKSNNHFGIKCHKNWNGGRTYHDDDKKGECFRVYKNPMNSYNDHSRFLTERSRYKNLFKLEKGDYKAWAKGLQKAGYATDKKYPQKLINIIEKYELYIYDEIVLGKKSYRTTSTTASINPTVYIVNKGDGLYSISRRFGVSIEELKDINNLTSDKIYVGQKLSLKSTASQVVEKTIEVSKDTVPPSKEIRTTNIPKNDESVSKELQYHIVQEGETLYQIAYKYDLAIPALRRWNNVYKDEVRLGQRIFIADPRKSGKSGNNDTHIVAQGDTLYSIARFNNTSVSEIKRLNNLEDNTIFIGQILVIK